MGYIMSIAMLGSYFMKGDAMFLVASALFYIGASIGACAGYFREKEEDDEK